MTKQEQLATLVCVSELLSDYVADLAYCGIITEKEVEPFNGFLEKIDKVAEAIRHETQLKKQSQKNKISDGEIRPFFST